MERHTYIHFSTLVWVVNVYGRRETPVPWFVKASKTNLILLHFFHKRSRLESIRCSVARSKTKQT